jgi:hypothetical protein
MLVLTASLVMLVNTKIHLQRMATHQRSRTARSAQWGHTKRLQPRFQQQTVPFVVQLVRNRRLLLAALFIKTAFAICRFI